MNWIANGIGSKWFLKQNFPWLWFMGGVPGGKGVPCFLLLDNLAQFSCQNEVSRYAITFAGKELLCFWPNCLFLVQMKTLNYRSWAINFIECAGVITFCRVKSAFSSNEVALPLLAEEGFTGLLGNSQTSKDKLPFLTEDLEEFSKDELLSVDSEGRCIITDHSHFGEWYVCVSIINIYVVKGNNLKVGFLVY